MPRTRTRNPTIYSSILGNPLASEAIYNFVNREDGGLGPVYFFNNYLVRRPRPTPPPVPPPVYSDKIVALLDFDDVVDQRVKNTLEYYFDNVPSFTRFIIDNTGGSVDKTLELLNNYYSKGFRYFIGFNQSVLLLLPEGIMQWFNDHPDTTPISTNSSTSLLGYQKSLYRLTPSDSILSQLFITIITGEKNVIYFIYDPTFPQNQALLLYFALISEQTEKTIVYHEISNITLENINAIMNSIHAGQDAVIVVSMLGGTNTFYNTFDSTTPNPGYNFFELSVIPDITSEQAKNYFNGILFAPDIANLSSSPLWRQGYNSLGEDKYNSKTLNAMIMAYTLESNEYITQLGSHDNTLIFNPITRDNDTASVSYLLFIAGNFIPKIIGFQNSLGEIYIGILE